MALQTSMNLSLQTATETLWPEVTIVVKSQSFRINMRGSECKGEKEGPRPLVSFSLQQLHILLSTAQHQRGRVG